MPGSSSTTSASTARTRSAERTPSPSTAQTRQSVWVITRSGRSSASWRLVDPVELLAAVERAPHLGVDLGRRQGLGVDPGQRHRGQRLDPAGVVALVGAADQRVAQPERAHDLGGRRQQRDDAHRRHGPDRRVPWRLPSAARRSGERIAHDDGVRDRRPGGGARRPPHLRRPGARRRRHPRRSRATPGIGKSTLWLAAVEHGARVRGPGPLGPAGRGRARPGPRGARRPARGVVGASCRGCRRRAGMRSRSPCCSTRRTSPVDARALGSAVLGVLQLLAEEQPVVVAIDDAQWLDAGSADAAGLRPAASRREPRAPAARAARRRGRRCRRWPSEASSGCRLGALGLGALHRLLRERLGRPFPRQTLERIRERSGGNPFYALELARLVDEAADPLEPLPLSDTLEELVAARLAGLPPETRDGPRNRRGARTGSASLLDGLGVPSPRSHRPSPRACWCGTTGGSPSATRCWPRRCTATSATSAGPCTRASRR